MKRLFKLFPCLIIISALLLFALTACSGGEEIMEVDTIEVDGFNYSINKIVDNDGNTIDHFAKVLKYTGDKEVVTVPNEVYYSDFSENISITTVAGLAFYNLEHVKNLTLSEGITTIEGFAFGYCGIMRVDIPSTIEKIGPWAFVNCLALREVRIKAEKSPEIGTYVFKYYDEEGTKDYEIDPELKIMVPSLSAYQTSNVLNNWIEYQDNLIEV